MRGWLKRFHVSKLYATGAVLLACGTLLGLGCKKQGFQLPPPEVTITQVIQKDTPVYVEFVAEAKGSEDIDIRARDEGWVESVNFKEGSEVKQGQLLYTIDPRHYEAKLAEAKGQHARAVAQLTNAEIELSRVRPLTEMNALSQRDLDNATARQKSAQAEVDATAGAVANAELNLSYTKVTAPITGIIGKTKAKVGDYVGLPPNVMIMNTVSNMNPILMQFYISESDYLKFIGEYGPKPGGATRMKNLQLILSDGSVFSDKGSIDFADREVDPNTGTIMVQASFPNPDKVVRPGAFGRVRFVAGELKGALLVPQRAVEELQGSYRVWVVGPENKAQVRPVKTGRKVGTLWVIDEGLKAGDKVILEGLTKVKPDMVVVPKEAKQEPEPSKMPAEGQKPEKDSGQTFKGNDVREKSEIATPACGRFAMTAYGSCSVTPTMFISTPLLQRGAGGISHFAISKSPSFPLFQRGMLSTASVANSPLRGLSHG